MFSDLRIFDAYLLRIADPEARQRFSELLYWIGRSFAQLEPDYVHRQPSFRGRSETILTLSAVHGAISIAPDPRAYQHFRDEIEAEGYRTMARFFRIEAEQAIAHPLLLRLIEWTLEDQAQRQDARR